jgi:hypothetical protein
VYLFSFRSATPHRGIFICTSDEKSEKSPLKTTRRFIFNRPLQQPFPFVCSSSIHEEYEISSLTNRCFTVITSFVSSLTQSTFYVRHRVVSRFLSALSSDLFGKFDRLIAPSIASLSLFNELLYTARRNLEVSNNY